MAVEARTRPTIRRHRTEDHRLPLPTRHKQMEQDRTPALLSHYRQLAWPAAGELPNRRQPYRQNHNLDRPRRRMRARPEHLPDKDQAHQAAEERDTHQTTRVPRGMELYHPTAMRTGCFIPAPSVGGSRLFDDRRIDSAKLRAHCLEVDGAEAFRVDQREFSCAVTIPSPEAVPSVAVRKQLRLLLRDECSRHIPQGDSDRVRVRPEKSSKPVPLDDMLVLHFLPRRPSSGVSLHGSPSQSAALGCRTFLCIASRPTTLDV